MALTPETAWRLRMTQNATMDAMISGRVYPVGNVPQTGVKPYIAYQRISTDNNHHIDGSSGLQIIRLQADIIAATYGAAQTLAENMRLATDGFRGWVNSGSDTLKLKMCRLDSQEDDPENPTAGEENGTFRVTQDWFIGFAVAKPTL